MQPPEDEAFVWETAQIYCSQERLCMSKTVSTVKHGY